MIGVANAANINIRVGPSTEVEIYGKLFTGQQVSVIGEADGFYRIEYEGRDDLYVFMEYIDLTEKTDYELTDPSTPLADMGIPFDTSQLIGTITGDYVNIRKYPSTEHNALAQAFTGDLFPVVSQCGDWYGILFNGQDAFVHKNYLTGPYLENAVATVVEIPDEVPSFGDDETYEMYAVVTSYSGLRLRSGPSTESSILTVFSYGMAMDVIENIGEWTKVSLGGTIGYVASEYVDINKGVRPENPLTRGQHIIAFARQFLGTPYVWGGASLTKGSDCSGFVYSVMKNFGVSLNRSSAGQFGDGKSISKGELQPGDLVFFDTDGNGRISHVGIYMGGSEFIHSSSSRRTWGVTISSLNEDYYKRTYLRACRVL